MRPFIELASASTTASAKPGRANLPAHAPSVPAPIYIAETRVAFAYRISCRIGKRWPERLSERRTLADVAHHARARPSD